VLLLFLLWPLLCCFFFNLIGLPNIYARNHDLNDVFLQFH
jgi:hypothetical protein